jgi:hypothetical protein
METKDPRKAASSLSQVEGRLAAVFAGLGVVSRATPEKPSHSGNASAPWQARVAPNV